MFYVVGGEYTSTKFTDFLDGEGQKHGPFKTYDEAYTCWAHWAWQTVDNCLCRFTIKEEK